MEWITAQRIGQLLHVAPIGETRYLVVSRQVYPACVEWTFELSEDWYRFAAVTHKHVVSEPDRESLEAAKAAARLGQIAPSPDRESVEAAKAAALAWVQAILTGADFECADLGAYMDSAATA